MTALRFSALVAWGFAVASTASATLVVLTDTRMITASGSDSTGLNVFNSITAVPGAAFNQSVTANGAGVAMSSTLSSTQLDFHTGSSFFLSGAYLPPNPGGPLPWTQNYGEASFQVTFRVDQPTSVLLTGWRDNETLGGIMTANLTNSSGNVPLNWGGLFPYFNSLNQSLLLSPDTYTLTGRIATGYLVSSNSYDGGTQRLDINVAVVPDSGSSALALAIGIGAVCLGFGNRRLNRVRAS
jgi:hypothetical protein